MYIVEIYFGLFTTAIHSLDSKKARIQYVDTRSVNIPSDPKYSKIVKNRELCEYEGPSLRVALF